VQVSVRYICDLKEAIPPDGWTSKDTECFVVQPWFCLIMHLIISILPLPSYTNNILTKPFLFLCFLPPAEHDVALIPLPEFEDPAEAIAVGAVEAAKSLNASCIIAVSNSGECVYIPFSDTYIHTYIANMQPPH